MGLVRKIHKVKLIVGLLSGDTGLLDKVRAPLVRIFGPIDYESPVLDFRYTDYYEGEMGKGLKRVFLAFEKLRQPDDIYKTKLKTNALEHKLSVRGKRRINIDPGYLDMSKLVLLSTKDYSHRIYLKKGIFAEVTLFYKDRKYNAWPWTYPDYGTQEYAGIFQAIREIYKRDTGIGSHRYDKT